jgi:caffeoyl-CoA O-methyltransferase
MFYCRRISHPGGLYLVGFNLPIFVVRLYRDCRARLQDDTMLRSMRLLGFLAALAILLISASYTLGQGPGRDYDLFNDLDSVKNPPLPKNDAEKKIISVMNDIRRGPWMANVHTLHGQLLRIFTETANAKNVVEIGTSNGYSALWICLGLRTTGGKLTTFEIDPGTASLARANFKRAGVEHLGTIITGDAHDTVSQLQGPIDILFIDADKDGYLDYLQKLLPLVRPGGLILADNVSKPAPSQAFLKAITTNPNLETVFLNMSATGLSVTLKKR